MNKALLGLDVWVMGTVVCDVPFITLVIVADKMLQKLLQKVSDIWFAVASLRQNHSHNVHCNCENGSCTCFGQTYSLVI